MYPFISAIKEMIANGNEQILFLSTPTTYPGKDFA